MKVKVKNGDREFEIEFTPEEKAEAKKYLDEGWAFVTGAAATPEVAATVEETPEHWKTGIKIEGGRETFQTFINCPNCGNKQKIFIVKDRKKVTCGSCTFTLTVDTATYSGFPNRDQYGNFYVAKRLG